MLPNKLMKLIFCSKCHNKVMHLLANIQYIQHQKFSNFFFYRFKRLDIAKTRTILYK